MDANDVQALEALWNVPMVEHPTEEPLPVWVPRDNYHIMDDGPETPAYRMDSTSTKLEAAYKERDRMMKIISESRNPNRGLVRDYENILRDIRTWTLQEQEERIEQ